MKVDFRRRSSGSPRAYSPGDSRDHAALVTQLALVVDHRHLRASDSPDDSRWPRARCGSPRCADRATGAPMTAHAWAQSARPDQLGLSPCSRAQVSKVSSSRSELQIRQRKQIGETAREQRAAIAYARRACRRARPRRRTARSDPASGARACRSAAARAAAAHAADPRSHRSAGSRPRSAPSTRDCRGRDSFCGSRTCSPTQSVTGLPERWISSASCTPVAEAPTTSTPPGGSCSGLR